MFIDADTVIYNDALSAGDAGRTIIWSDDTTLLAGSIFARGATTSGNADVLVGTSDNQDPSSHNSSFTTHHSSLGGHYRFD